MSKEVKIGDKVRVTTNRYSSECPSGTFCTVAELREGGGITATIDDVDDFGWFFFNGEYELVSDETPKLWRDMSEEEKSNVPDEVLNDPTNPLQIPWGEWARGAKKEVLWANHEGRWIETLVGLDTWLKVPGSPRFSNDRAYRAKPEPVRETFTHTQWVSMHEGLSGGFSLIYGEAYSDDVKGQTTIETVDGKPVRVIWEAYDEKAEEL